jgi:hypothetical protein
MRRPGGTRAKDSDRTATCQILDSALADGQLSMAEHQHRVTAAMAAATLSELESLIADLQTTGLVAPFVTSAPKLSRGPLIVGGIAVAAVLLCAVVVVVLMSTDSASSSGTPSSSAAEKHELAAEPTPSASTSAPADPPPVVLGSLPDLHTAEGLTLVVDEIRKRFGDTMGYELAITPTEATLARPDPTDDTSKLLYTFDAGWGDPSARPRSDTDDLTDLAAFDVPATAAALQAAPETLGVERGTVTDTVIDVDHVAEPGAPGALELLIRLSTTAGADGWIYLDPAGNIKRVENPS